MNEHTNELLTLPRLARRLGVTQAWLKTQADSGQIPALRAGTRFLDDLRHLTKANRNPVAYRDRDAFENIPVLEELFRELDTDEIVVAF